MKTRSLPLPLGSACGLLVITALSALAQDQPARIDSGFWWATPIIQYLSKTDFPSVVNPLPITFERQDYDIAPPVNSLLRERINQAMRRCISQPVWQETLRHYLGN